MMNSQIRKKCSETKQKRNNHDKDISYRPYPYGHSRRSGVPVSGRRPAVRVLGCGGRFDYHSDVLEMSEPELI